MRYDHVQEIIQEYGYQDFASQPEPFRFIRWLYTRVWWSEERLTVLFDPAMAHLIDRKVLLPGVSALERAVSSVREHASMRLWQRLSQIPTPPQRALLETLLVVPVCSHRLFRGHRAPLRPISACQSNYGKHPRNPETSCLFPTGYTLIRPVLAFILVHSSLPERKLSMN